MWQDVKENAIYNVRIDLKNTLDYVKEDSNYVIGTVKEKNVKHGVKKNAKKSVNLVPHHAIMIANLGWKNLK